LLGMTTMSSPVPKSKLAGGQCLIIIGTEGFDLRQEPRGKAARRDLRGGPG
jgi:hypothetical protein